MEYNIEELAGLRRRLKITIPPEVVSERVDVAYGVLNKQMRIAGFRPGKIPRNILEQQVPIHSLSDMFQEMMQEYYEKVLKATGLIPVGEPEIDHSDIKEIKKDAAFSFSVLLDIKPTMTLKPYKGLNVKRLETRVTKEQVENAIKKIIEPLGQFEPYEEGHAVQKTDFVLLDFEGTHGGEPLPNGSGKDYRVRIGEKTMIPGFEDQVIGHKAGDEFEIKVPLPQNWNNQMRRVSMPIPGSKEDAEVDAAVFKVKLKEIEKLMTPELTDELVQCEKIGMKSVDQFRRAIEADMQSYIEHQEEVRIKEELFEKIIKDNEIDPPESIVNRELKFMIEGMKYQIQQSGMKLEDSGFDPEQAKVELRQKAEHRAKGYTLLEEIANVENIHIAESDLEAEYQRLAQETKQKVEVVKQRMMQNRESMSLTTSKLRGQKALNLVFSHCEFDYEREEPKADANKE